MWSLHFRSGRSPSVFNSEKYLKSICNTLKYFPWKMIKFSEEFKIYVLPWISLFVTGYIAWIFYHHVLCALHVSVRKSLLILHCDNYCLDCITVILFSDKMLWILFWNICGVNKLLIFSSFLLFCFMFFWRTNGQRDGLSGKSNGKENTLFIS